MIKYFSVKYDVSAELSRSDLFPGISARIESLQLLAVQSMVLLAAEK
jgi:hypothetical protein